MLQWIKKLFSSFTTIKRYRVAYLETYGCMTVVEENYICYANSKYHAWTKFIKDIGAEDHYTCRENLNSYILTEEDIHRIADIKIECTKETHYEYILEKDIIGIDANCCPFCNTRTQSGSWSPDTCPDCNAVYFFGRWTRDIKE